MTRILPFWMCLFCSYVDDDSRLYRITRFYELKVEANLCSVVLRLHLVFFYSMSVCNNCFRFSDFEILILKIWKFFACHLSDVQKECEILLPLLFLETHYKSSIFVFLALLLKGEAHMLPLASPPHNAPWLRLSRMIVAGVKPSDDKFGFFRLPRKISRTIRCCRGNGCGTVRYVCEFERNDTGHVRGTDVYVWISL